MLRLKEIAAVLEETARHMPEASLAHDEPMTTSFGAFKIRCRPDAPSIRAVAAKYRTKAIHMGSDQAPSQHYNERGEPRRYQNVNKRWFDPRPVPLGQAGEGQRK